MKVILMTGEGHSRPAELLHPGPGEGFIGGHRRVEGGLLTEDGALLVLPGLLDAVVRPDGLWLANRQRDGVALWCWAEGALRLRRELSCSGLHLGAQWLCAWKGEQAWAEDLAEGTPVRLPMGALEARARPWSVGAGASWCLGRSLVEQAAGGSARVVGTADGPLRGLVVGPEGAAVAEAADGAWGRAPGGPLRRLALALPLGEVAFSPDGRHALVEGPEGTARVGLHDGLVAGMRQDARPAGWGRWVDPSGAVHPWRRTEGEERLPGPGLVLDGQLHGPGGLAWDLGTGRPTGTAWTAGADLALATPAGVLLVEEGELLLRTDEDVDEDVELLRLPEDETALELRQIGALVVLRCTGGVAWGPPGEGAWQWRPLPLPADRGGPLLRLDEDGSVLVPGAEQARRLPGFRRATLPPLPSPPVFAPTPALALGLALGLPLDGSCVAPDGRIWAWQDDGLLLRLTAGTEPSG